MPDSYYIRRAQLTLIAMAFVLPFVFMGFLGSLGDMQNNPVAWLPETSRPRVEIESFSHAFKTHDTVVVSWDGCTIDDERLRYFVDAMHSPEGIEYLDKKTNLTGRVLDGYTAVRDLSEILDLTKREAADRLRGLLVGEGDMSCVLVTYRWKAPGRRDATIEFLRDTAEQAGAPRETIRLAGSIIEGRAIDHESSRSFTTLAIPAAVISILICWLCLRSWRMTGAVLLIAGFCQALVVAIVNWSGIQMNAVLIVMAPLMFVLTVSAGVHMANYYREECCDGGFKHAVDRALKAGWWPCTFCAITTALGMASLAVSQIIPVNQFGLITSFGVLFAISVMFMILPGAMAWQGRDVGERGISAKTNASHGDWGGLTRWLSGAWAPVMLLGLVSMGFGLYGVTRVNTTVEVLNLLQPKHRLVQDYRWFESSLGALVPLEVIVHMPVDSEMDGLEKLALIRNVEDRLRANELLGGVVSAATFFPDIPPPGGLRQTARRVATRVQFERLEETFEENAWLDVSEGRQSWRISTRVPAFGGVDYNRLLQELQSTIDSDLRAEPTAGITATLTGLTPVVSQAQRMLLDDLFHSFAIALLLVCVIMIVVFRSVATGLLAMLPNVFPSIVLFGAMGLFELKVDIGTVMTASVALGIAVDDTIHFLTWFRRGYEQEGNRSAAVAFAFKRTAYAMIQTTAICGFGLAPFVFAEFLPTAKFAWMMLALLVTALIGDLLFLPAILLSPLGRLATPRIAQESHALPIGNAAPHS